MRAIMTINDRLHMALKRSTLDAGVGLSSCVEDATDPANGRTYSFDELVKEFKKAGLV